MIDYGSTKNIEIKERKLAKINTTPLEDQNQTLAYEKLGAFSSYFAKLKVGSLLNRSGIVKTKGAPPLEIFTIIFNLSFVGKNFYEGLVRNQQKFTDLQLAAFYSNPFFENLPFHQKASR